MSQLTKQIAFRLRAARRTAGFKSARKFAMQYDIPESTYSQHETGTRALKSELLLYYAKLLNINPTWLLTGKQFPYLLENWDPEYRKRLCQKVITLRNYINISDDSDDILSVKCALIDIQLFNNILKKAVKALLEKQIDPKYSKLIKSCIEIYNDITALEVKPEQRNILIDIYLASLTNT